MNLYLLNKYLQESESESNELSLIDYPTFPRRYRL